MFRHDNSLTSIIILETNQDFAREANRTIHATNA